MADRELFVEHDKTKEPRECADRFEADWDGVAGSALATDRPTPKLIFDCRGCSFFGAECHASDEPHHIFDLPRLSRSRFEKLSKYSVTTIARIPAEMPLTRAQERVRKSVVSGKPLVSKKELAQLLRQVTWPAYYLDFETSSQPFRCFLTPLHMNKS